MRHILMIEYEYTRKWPLIFILEYID
jgi:hypothetical protein